MAKAVGRGGLAAWSDHAGGADALALEAAGFLCRSILPLKEKKKHTNIRLPHLSHDEAPKTTRNLGFSRLSRDHRRSAAVALRLAILLDVEAHSAQVALGHGRLRAEGARGAILAEGGATCALLLAPRAGVTPAVPDGCLFV